MNECRDEKQNNLSTTALQERPHLRLKLQILSAVSQSQFQRRFLCTGVLEVPCALGAMMASVPGTQGAEHGDDLDTAPWSKNTAKMATASLVNMSIRASFREVIYKKECDYSRIIVCLPPSLGGGANLSR